jgi:Tfp pilus assembly protein PilE
MTTRERIPDWAKVASVVVAIASIVAMVMVACWREGTDRKAAASGAYAGVLERVAKVETSQADHNRWAEQRNAEVIEEIRDVKDTAAQLREDFVSQRAMQATTLLVAESAEKHAAAASKGVDEVRSLLIELLREQRRAANANGNGKVGG